MHRSYEAGGPTHQSHGSGFHGPTQPTRSSIFPPLQRLRDGRLGNHELQPRGHQQKRHRSRPQLSRTEDFRVENNYWLPTPWRRVKSNLAPQQKAPQAPPNLIPPSQSTCGTTLTLEADRARGCTQAPDTAPHVTSGTTSMPRNRRSRHRAGRANRRMRGRPSHETPLQPLLGCLFTWTETRGKDTDQASQSDRKWRHSHPYTPSLRDVRKMGTNGGERKTTIAPEHVRRGSHVSVATPTLAEDTSLGVTPDNH